MSVLLWNCKTIGKLEKCVCFLDFWGLCGLLGLLYFIECRAMWQMLNGYLSLNSAIIKELLTNSVVLCFEYRIYHTGSVFEIGGPWPIVLFWRLWGLQEGGPLKAGLTLCSSLLADLSACWSVIIWTFALSHGSYHSSKPFSAMMKWNPSIALSQRKKQTNKKQTKEPSIPQVVPAWCLVTATEHSQCVWWHETKESLEFSSPSATKTWLIQTHMNPWTRSCQSCLWWASNTNSRMTVEMPGGHVKPLQAPLLGRVRNQQVARTWSVSQGICNNLERLKTGMKIRPLYSAVWVTGYTVWVSVLAIFAKNL